MKESLTDVTVILDRSGSMEGVAGQTIEGFNRLLDDQKAQPGDAVFSLVQFDDEYEEVQAAVPILQALPLTPATFVPRGQTALLDAFGLTIDRVGARLATLAEPDRPSKVIIALMTDGHENASSTYRREQVTRMVRKQESRYGWTFMFLGAGLDAIDHANRLGISRAMSSAYTSDGDGIANAYQSLAANVSRVRQGNRSGFTADDRKKMKH